MSKPSVSSIGITRVNGNNSTEEVDLLAAEEPMEIRIGYGGSGSRQQKSISVTMRTPGHDFELAAGFLFTEGIISDPAHIYKIQYCTEANTLENKENIVRVELHEQVSVDLSKLQRNFYTTSSCGVCGKESIDAIRTACPVPVSDTILKIDKELIISLPGKLRQQQNVFEYTGGLHASALFNLAGDLLLLREDVGRHNALDKLIGASFVNKKAGDGLNIPLDHHILLLSGRASFELIQKAAMAGVQVVCAVGAPSSLAVELANEFRITLIGFLRDNRFNIYTHPERIITGN